MTDRLLFVNKTPSSSLLTRSKRAEKAKILSHVQSNRRKQEARRAGRDAVDQRQARTRTTVSPTEIVISLGPGTDGVADDTRQRQRQSLLSSTFISSYYPTHNSSDPFHCTVASTDAGNHLLLHCTLYSVWRGMFLGEAFAPADVIAAFQAQGQKNTDQRHAPFFTQRLRRCVEDPALMYATLAYGSSYLAWTTGQTPPSGEATPLPPAEYFLGKALREVRIRLAGYNHGHLPSSRQDHQNQHDDRNQNRNRNQSTEGNPEGPAGKRQQEAVEVDPWLVLAIYSLAVTEQWNGMPELWRRFPQKYAAVVKTCQFGRGASRVHMRALLRLVSFAGGWDGLSDRGGDGGLKGYLLDSAVLADKYLSMYEFTEPLVPLDWARGVGNMPPTNLAEGGEGDSFPRMGTGFVAVPELVLSTEVKGVLADITSYCRIAHLAWQKHPTGGGMDSAMEIWLFRRFQQLICRLMALSYRTGGGAEGHTNSIRVYGECPSPVADSTPRSAKARPSSSVDQCVCLAAQIFLLGCTVNIGAQTSAKYQALRLRVLMMDHVDKLRKNNSPMDKGLKLWCLSTAALLADKFPARGWFVDRMKEVWTEGDGLGLQYGQNQVGGSFITEEALCEALEPYMFLRDRQREGIVWITGEV